MDITKKIGVWLDHSHAKLTEFTSDQTPAVTVESRFTPDEEQKLLSHGDYTSQNKEKHRRSEYYRKISDAIVTYDEVLLFGPTSAKLELFNILIADSRFAKVKTEVKNADKMTDNQQLAFIKEFFSRHLAV